MRYKAPSWWWQSKPSLFSRLLGPVSWVYGQISTQRQRWDCKRQIASHIPVISVGSLLMGGSGKTPVTLSLAQLCAQHNFDPILVTRGYGGAAKGPLWVNPEKHSFQDVGDEPLLLATAHPTILSHKRSEALSLIGKSPFKNPLILLDDGHQHHSLKKNVSLLVINAFQQWGNGCVFPAGPLREPFQRGLQSADFIVWVGDTPSPLSLPKPVWQASLKVHCPFPPNTPVVAFAGLGYPENFYKTLLAQGLQVKAFQTFPDHYSYQPHDLQNLQQQAKHKNAFLITTDKDQRRIPFHVSTLTIEVVWENSQEVWHQLEQRIQNV